jgi:hypothetical protein
MRRGQRAVSTLPQRIESARRRAIHDDQRWLAVALSVFVLTIVLFALLLGLYRFTGPHPLGTRLLRRMHFYARWLLPGI